MEKKRVSNSARRTLRCRSRSPIKPSIGLRGLARALDNAAVARFYARSVIRLFIAQRDGIFS